MKRQERWADPQWGAGPGLRLGFMLMLMESREGHRRLVKPKIILASARLFSSPPCTLLNLNLGPLGAVGGKTTETAVESETPKESLCIYPRADKTMHGNKACQQEGMQFCIDLTTFRKLRSWHLVPSLHGK